MITTTPHRPRRSPRWLLAPAALAVTALALTATVTPAVADTVPPPCGPLASAPPWTLPATTVPAGPVLIQLAGRITAIPADTQPGPYIRLTVRLAGADSSIGDCVETVTAVADETRWRDESTDSGRVTGTPWHTAGTTPPPLETTWYRPGDLRGELGGRVPTDPVRLTAALAVVQPESSDRRASTLRAARQVIRAALQRAGSNPVWVGTLADVAAWHDTPPGARRAILRVLADIPGLRAHGPVTVDGRTGIAVSVDRDGVRFVLVIDPRTGEIHAAEEVLTDPVIGRNLAVETPYTFSRTVITDRGHTTGPRAGSPA